MNGAGVRRVLRAGRHPVRSARRLGELQQRVLELEQRLDHERLYPGEWVNRRVRDRFGNAAKSGPFKGMTYPDWGMTHVDLFAPKVLGTFERELHDDLEDLIAARPATVVNVGAAEGYYAVGLALRLPAAEVVAFDANTELHWMLRAIAETNGVAERIRIAGACGHEELRAVAAPGTLIVSDCEGCEMELLDLDRVPALSRCTILTETHDHLAPGATDALRARFTATHDVRELQTEPWFVGDFPELDFMPLVSQQLAISEFRSAPMRWLVLRPRD